MNTLSQRDPADDRLARRACLVAVLLAIGGIAALAVDMPVARAVAADAADVPGRTIDIPGDLKRTVHLAEAFGHGSGVALILLAYWTLDRPRRRATLRLAVSAYGAGLVVVVLKMLVCRTRPIALGADVDAGVFSTFGDWLPLGASDYPIQSCPSGHSATAAAFAVALIWRYSQGKWVFSFFAALVLCQRVLARAHFPSDVLWGAAVGCAFAALCIHNRLLGAAFDRFEAM